MSKAFLDTTVLTDILLKTADKKKKSFAAINKYSESHLPVYAIKEFKAGPLLNFAYVHDKLLIQGKLSTTIEAINRLYHKPYKKSTALDALATATSLISNSEFQVKRQKDQSINRDKELADELRINLKRLIFTAWKKRRKVTDIITLPLSCYEEKPPKLNNDNSINLKPTSCKPKHECCLADELKSNIDILRKLDNEIKKDLSKNERKRQHKVLNSIIKKKNKFIIGDRECRNLGDVIIVFFCPKGSSILTTNKRDFDLLAAPLNKKVDTI